MGPEASLASPALLLVLGAGLIPLLPLALRGIYMMALPVIGFFWFVGLPTGDVTTVQYLGLELVPVRVDGWTRLFGYVFFLATLIAVIFALHVRDTLQQVAGMAYAGGAIGAVMAGDYLTLFVYWEVTAIASVFLVWARRTDRAYATGMRYVSVQLLSGFLLLAGALTLYGDTGSLRFEHVELEGLGPWLIFLGFGIKCAFPLLHNWLPDAYPEATGTGTVFLSAFTTKLATYALARGFAGTEILIWIGAIMTIFPVFYAIIENNLRRALAYSLNIQLGFIVVGIGIGTEMALNGAAAHAFCHIVYKSLLYMSMGAVLLRAGTTNANVLGGLYKSMPWTTGFCVVGAASASAFPLFSAFVSKSLIISAAAAEGMLVVWAVLIFASAVALYHTGLKIPYFAFFAQDRGIRCEEAPRNMLVAMGIAAFICVFIGVNPGTLYSILPYVVDYEPYTGAHVLTQLQLLLFSGLAFAVLMRHRLYPRDIPSENLDVDWLYRRAGPATVGFVRRLLARLDELLAHDRALASRSLSAASEQWFGSGGDLSRARSTRTMVMWVAILLGLSLALFYS